MIAHYKLPISLYLAGEDKVIIDREPDFVITGAYDSHCYWIGENIELCGCNSFSRININYNTRELGRKAFAYGDIKWYLASEWYAEHFFTVYEEWLFNHTLENLIGG